MHVDTIPGGPFDLAVVVANGFVVASGFTPAADVWRTVSSDPMPAEMEIPQLRQAWSDYLAGEVAALNSVNIQQAGSPVQEDVWVALRAIPPGETETYSGIARKIGRPKAARAVGSACGANGIAPFVPCHRVVAAGGSLGGYAYGLEAKQWLLRHERAATNSHR